MVGNFQWKGQSQHQPEAPARRKSDDDSNGVGFVCGCSSVGCDRARRRAVNDPNGVRFHSPGRSPGERCQFMMSSAPTGRHPSRRAERLRPFRAGQRDWGTVTQGCALGFRMTPRCGYDRARHRAVNGPNGVGFDSPGLAEMNTRRKPQRGVTRRATRPGGAAIPSTAPTGPDSIARGAALGSDAHPWCRKPQRGVTRRAARPDAARPPAPDHSPANTKREPLARSRSTLFWLALRVRVKRNHSHPPKTS